MNQLLWLLAGVRSDHHAATSGAKVLGEADCPQPARPGTVNKDL